MGELPDGCFDLLDNKLVNTIPLLVRTEERLEYSCIEDWSFSLINRRLITSDAIPKSP
jgi:hypothetical protein